MIELRADKTLIMFEDSDLVRFLTDAKNKGLKAAFEKAVNGQVSQHGDNVLVYADKKADRGAIESALKEMSEELKTIPQDRFMAIINKTKKAP